MLNILDRNLIQDQIYQNTYNSLKALIDNSYYTQLTMPKHNIPNIPYLKEFCTIKLANSRRSGHTTSLCKLAYEYFDKVAIICLKQQPAQLTHKSFIEINQLTKEGNENSGKYLLDQIKSLRLSNNEINMDNKHYFFTSIQSIDNQLRGREFEAFFIDCSFGLTNGQIENIYNLANGCMHNYKQKFIVFVG